MRKASLRLQPFCRATSTTRSGGRTSTAAVAVASQTKADSSPTALMSSSVAVAPRDRRRRRGSRLASGRRSSHSPATRTRTYLADGAAVTVSAQLSNSGAHLVHGVDHHLAHERRTLLVDNRSHC